MVGKSKFNRQRITHYNFFNDISLFDFEELANFDCNNLSSRSSLIENQFKLDIAELKKKSVGNKTRTALLNYTEGMVLIVKGIVRERSLVTQTEYVNYWIARLLLCQNAIISIGKLIEFWCANYKLWWKKYIIGDISEVPDKRYLFREIYKIYTAINGACENIGVAINDYEELWDNVDSNISIKEADF